MGLLEQILENTENGEECLVIFSNGDQLGLKNFQMVDESIYGRTDLCVAEVVTRISCDRRFYTVGTGIEFSLNDVESVVNPKTGKKIWG